MNGLLVIYSTYKLVMSLVNSRFQLVLYRKNQNGRLRERRDNFQ